MAEKGEVCSETAWALDGVMPETGPLWYGALASLPVDRWLQQGEVIDLSNWPWPSQPAILLSLYPQESLPPRSRLALGLYQALLVAEALVCGQRRMEFMRSLSRILSLPKSRARFGLWTLSRSRLLSRLRSLSILRSRSRSRARARSGSEFGSGSVLRIAPVLSEYLRGLLQIAEECLEPPSKGEIAAHTPALNTFGYRYAALDWFDEQAEDPALMTARGLRPGQPLPPELGLFDPQGRLRSPLPRSALQALESWLGDHDAILRWLFPDGLTPEDEQDLRDQLAILAGQPWSPRAAVRAALQDWPEELAERDTTLAAAEAPLIEVLESLLPDPPA